jgi:hypothetical protein
LAALFFETAALTGIIKTASVDVHACSISEGVHFPCRASDLPLPISSS